LFGNRGRDVAVTIQTGGILITAFIGVSSAAIGQDRVAALPALERLCANTVLTDPQAIRGLAILQTNLPDCCSCVSTQMISAFTEAEVAVYARSRQLPTRANDIWQAASRFCKAALMRPLGGFP
jgi:hypothetical protein